MTKKEQCEFCNGPVKHRAIRAEFHYKGETIFVDNVPAWVCSQCAEQYFDAPVYKRFEEIACHRRQIKKTVSFPLAEFEMLNAKA